MQLDREGVPRGVAPKILLEQVRNTAPFALDPAAEPTRPGRAYLATLQGLAQDPELELSHASYFELCLSAHHATVATFVPTDVDSQIRFPLWHPALATETIAQMSRLVIDSADWDHSPVSARWLRAPATGELISGHSGEWFSTAAAAYGTLRRRDPDRAAEVAGLIYREVRREAEVVDEFRQARDGIGLLKAGALAAHNLGDLDRVIEMWNLPENDPLREAVYRSGHQRTPAAGGSLARAGALNKATTAAENHRHFALRGVRCLRRSADLLLPIGPFFDDWGSRVASHPALSREEVGAIAGALIDGWERLKGPVGYARALAGMLEAFPGGMTGLSGYLPARPARALKSGVLRNLCSVPQRRFEDQWAQAALRQGS